MSKLDSGGSFSEQKNAEKQQRGKNELWKPLIYSFDRYVKRPIFGQKVPEGGQRRLSEAVVVLSLKCG